MATVNEMQKLIILFLRGYRYLFSPWLGNHCRFYPSCSHYGEQAVRQHGALYGTWLILRRLSKCHPWHAGGLDEVPTLKNKE